MDWLRYHMQIRGLSQHDLAEKIGMTDQMFTNVVKGRRQFKAAEVDAIRNIFGFTLPEDRNPTIAVAGKVGAGDHIDLVDDYALGSGLYLIERPDWIPPRGVCAAVVDGSSAEPWALHGDIVFWRRDFIAANVGDLGRPVVAELADGRVMLKRLASGTRPGLWSLLSINPTHPSLIDVPLKWAARALAPLPADQVRVVEA